MEWEILVWILVVDYLVFWMFLLRFRSLRCKVLYSRVKSCKWGLVIIVCFKSLLLFVYVGRIVGRICLFEYDCCIVVYSLKLIGRWLYVGKLLIFVVWFSLFESCIWVL